MTKYKTFTVYCKCGQKLVKYKKGPGRRLIKMRKERIIEDFSGVLYNNYEENTEVFCPKCKGRLATVKIIGGYYVNKLNQGQIGTIK